MGDAQLTLAQRESMLRRVAVFLSSLPAPTASKLLSGVDAQSRNIVNQAIATLAPVQLAEREEVLGSFKEGLHHDLEIRTSATLVESAGSVHDEINIGQDSKSPAATKSSGAMPRYRQSLASILPPSESTAPPQNSPFAFLADVAVDDLAELLGGEHPQTIALVLASIPPKQAAKVLPQLDTSVQNQTLSRIGRLDEATSAATTEVAAHLKQRLQTRRQAETAGSGKLALQAIMAELPELAVQAKNGPVPDEPLDRSTTPAQHDTPPLKLAAGSWQEDTIEHTDDIRIALPSNHESETIVQVLHDADPPAADVARPPCSKAVDSPDSTITLSDATHQYLIELSSSDLVFALGRVRTREALLTLCGLPNDVAERAIALLPRAKAKRVRRGMSTLGSLQLREIDEAKVAVARVSVDTSTTARANAA
ncbi:MAG: hypothetical protein HKN47_06740 [Pirellulaceae bacterium]|nr:hypothetical protein [Pirellulaceae bacterium]